MCKSSIATFASYTVALLLIASLPQTASAQPPAHVLEKIGPLASRQLPNVAERSRVIVRAVDGTPPSALMPLLQGAGGSAHKTLAAQNAQAVELPNALLLTVAESPLVARISLDRPIFGAMERTGSTVGATAIRQVLGYDGAGVGAAIIDSGVTPWHDDLTIAGASQRVYHFVDFTDEGTTAHDDYGHGTHVAGIVAGNGFDSSGNRSGIAPAAHLVVLKVLDASGRGHISNVIAALDYVVANKDALNIRVVNLSIATGVYESYNTDPLTLAAKRTVDAGIVVVAAAGNYGRHQDGTEARGGITAPGNAPWVLTVGASSHMGTVDRADDTMAAFSSRGPTAVDHSAKPDVVAPGVGIESLSDPQSAFYETKSAYLLNGTVPTTHLPYLSLSGTSMAAPVVSGTVALMLQANPALTPNQVKAIVQYTAQDFPDHGPLTEGAGFLNAEGAVKLAAWFADRSSVYPVQPEWGRQLIWGNRLITADSLTTDLTVWSENMTWGAGTTSAGEPVVWGATDDDSVVWGTADDDSVVWGTSDDDSVVWGTSGDDDDSVVWGTSCGDTACEPVIWPTP